MAPARSLSPAQQWSLRGAVVVLALSAVSAVLPLPAAHAVSKATLLALVEASYSDYAATKPVSALFPSYDRLRWQRSYATSTGVLYRVRAQLRAADTPSRVEAIAPYVRRERTRARVFRISTTLDRTSFAARNAARNAGQRAFSDRLAGNVTGAAYAERRNDAAAVAGLAAADRRRAWAALGGTVAPAASKAYPALPALTSTARVTMPTGWVAVPGGCAVPAASSAWIGSAAQPGRHLWVSEEQIASARTRAESGPALAQGADIALRRAADRMKTPITTDLTAVATPLKMRSSRLGYQALMGDAEAQSWLEADLEAVVPPGPLTGNPLRDAIALEGLATDLDWTGADEAPGAAAELLREALLVRWLGPLSCRFDDRETTVVDNDNISIINDTAMLHGALALAPAEPGLAAGLARAALVELVVGARAMTADGGSFEGPSYWNLQARYLGGAYGTVASTYGTSPPVALPAPSRTADYAWSSVTADGSSLAFADSLVDPEGLRPGLVTWVAHRTSSPAAGALARMSLVVPTEGFQLLWWPTDEALAAPPPARASSLFRRTGLAALHAGTTTAWLKGGTTKEEHTHLDLGNVGFYKHGLQWAVDPGQDDYALEGYGSSNAESKRWTYWKVAARGHTTLRPTAGQPPLRSAPFTAFSPTSGVARVDLLGAMPGASTASRTCTLSPEGVLVVRDRVTSTLARSWLWGWVTDADVTVAGTGSTRTISLTRDDHVVQIVLSGLPARTAISVVSAPSTATGPTGLPLRAVTVTLGATTSLAVTATVS
ncbi:MAG TPA: hypothetical protein VM097_06960 [Mycobacteriales bacterium]|nr:hypothetical protein [Mycobacteriales bacterium]